ncbi:MAG: hypothetical protein RR482_09760, partial [Clostridia bacterium]
MTLSETFLEKPPDVPEQWEADPIWRTEVLMRRKLALDMIVNTIVDATHCTAVQLLIQKDGSDQQGRRMMRMELFASETDPTQLLGLAQRSETMILTHYHTASIILRSWQHKEWQRLYRFVAQQSGRPTANAFAQMVAEDSASLLSFSITPGQVSADGQQAVLNVQLELSNEDGTSTLSNSIPMHIALENGIWKISYAMLSQLMQTRERGKRMKRRIALGCMLAWFAYVLTGCASSLLVERDASVMPLPTMRMGPAAPTGDVQVARDVQAVIYIPNRERTRLTAQVVHLTVDAD